MSLLCELLDITLEISSLHTSIWKHIERCMDGKVKIHRRAHVVLQHASMTGYTKHYIYTSYVRIYVPQYYDFRVEQSRAMLVVAHDMHKQ